MTSRLSSLSEQLRPGAAENQKARPAGAIREHPQRGKDVRASLNLVEHHLAAQRFERQQGIRELGHIPAGFEIEVRDAGSVGPDDLAGQGRLANLAGT
jgi:hypothetical protein